MYIKKLVLKDYIPFKDSAISSLAIDFTAPVQIIIGSNGSGKTACCRQLSLYPPVRSIFGKNGAKSIVIEKDGDTYTLDSDYSKSTSPHQFFKNDNLENLNVGRTTDVQKDFISDTIGITPFIDDLIMNRFDFPKWTASKRKEFVMSANPDKIGFIQNNLKTVSSKIRACKNNLSRLQSRKILLENEFLSEENLLSLTEEKQQIESDLIDLQKSLMHVEIDLKSISESNESQADYNFNKIADQIRSHRYKLSGLSTVNRNDSERDKDRQDLILNISGHDQKISIWEDMVSELLSDIEQMEIRYREISPTENIHDIDAAIARLEEEKERLKVNPPPFELSEDELKSRCAELDTIQSRLSIFDHCPIPLYSRIKRNKRRQVLQNLQYRIDSWNMTLADLKTRFASFESRNTLSPSDIPDSPCSKNKCPLYAHFIEEYEHAEGQRLVLKSKIDRLSVKLKRAQLVAHALKSYFDDSQIYHDTIHWIVSQAQSNPIFHQVLRGMDILTVLKSNPNRIIMNLKDSYDSIRNWIKMKSIDNDLKLAYEIKTKYASLEGDEILSLTTSIELQKSKIEDLKNKIDMSVKDKTYLQNKLEYIERFNSVKTSVFGIRDQYDKIMSDLSSRYKRETLLLAQRTITQIRSDKFMRMSELEKTLRYQETLKARYDTEVVSEITAIETDMKELEHIEKALIAIPRESTIGFINTLFDQANCIIECVWTIPLSIELLESEDPLNYEFYVSGDNTSLRELGECSEGQTEIISLALNISLRVVLGHLEMPLVVDEIGRTFDERHKERLISLLKNLVEDKIISQLFIVSHHALIHEGFVDQETFVIRDDNILIPPSGSYNNHVVMT